MLCLMLSMGSRCPSLTLSTASALSSVARRSVPSPEWRKHPSGPLLVNRRNFPKLWYCRPFLPCPFVDDLWWLATLPHQLLSPKDAAYCAALLSCLMWAAWLIDSLGPCVNIFDGARLLLYDDDASKEEGQGKRFSVNQSPGIFHFPAQPSWPKDDCHYYFCCRVTWP